MAECHQPTVRIPDGTSVNAPAGSCGLGADPDRYQADASASSASAVRCTTSPAEGIGTGVVSTAYRWEQRIEQFEERLGRQPR